MPLTSGDRLGPYEILGPIGAGGMGEVYRARDVALGREVALKVLAHAGDAEHSRRFPDEARLASSLNHPNIVQIYGLGEEGDVLYIAMELVRGRTLRALLGEGALPVPKALHLATQVADAMAAAHASGIVHRDLKPDNIMVTAEDRVKVLDFGLAKRQGGLIAEGQPPNEAATETCLTVAGAILGTIGYMAPEQAAGRPLGPTADQFSFGAILYEMLSGRRAFKRDTAVATLSAILSETPPPIDTLNPAVPASLQQIVERCLAKNPADRYPATADLVVQLAAAATAAAPWVSRLTRRRAIWLGGVAAASVVTGASAWKLWPNGSGIRVLAVYPFENSAKDDDAEFLCDGVTRSLIRQLTTLPGLKVKRGPKGKIADPQEAGRRLKVDAIVTGSITRRPGKILVSVELLDARTGDVLWSSPSYDRDESELLRTQDEIVNKIIDEGIRMKLSSADRRRLSKRSTNDPEALQLFMRAIYHHGKETEADYLSARALLLQAVERDKNFALAYWALAWNYLAMTSDGYTRPAEVWPVARAYAQQALSLDDTLAEPHGALGTEALCHRWNWAEAEREFGLALRAPEPDVWIPYMFERWAVGRNEDAFRVMGKAVEVEPASVIWRVKQADLYLRARQADTAGKLYENIIADAPDDSRAYFGLAEVAGAQERFDDAIEFLRQGYLALGVEDDALLKVLSEARGAEGYRKLERMGAQHELDVLADRAAANKYASPLDYARAHARLGDKDEAFRYLDAALAEKSPALVYLKADRAWDLIRNDDRFRDAVKKIGIP
jgi:serine/threonine protein kinase/Tfp pilus assembly protein PilF